MGSSLLSPWDTAAYKQDSRIQTYGTASTVLRWRTTHVGSTADSLCKCRPQGGQWVPWSTSSICLITVTARLQGPRQVTPGCHTFVN